MRIQTKVVAYSIMSNFCLYFPLNLAQIRKYFENCKKSQTSGLATRAVRVFVFFAGELGASPMSSSVSDRFRDFFGMLEINNIFANKLKLTKM